MSSKVITFISCLFFMTCSYAQDIKPINMENCIDNAKDAAAVTRIQSLCEITFPADAKTIIKNRNQQCLEKYIYGDLLFEETGRKESSRLNKNYFDAGAKDFCNAVPNYIEQIRNSTGGSKNE